MQNNAGHIFVDNQGAIAGDMIASVRSSDAANDWGTDDFDEKSAPNDFASGASDPKLGDWENIRADSDIQFAPIELPERTNEPPGWLENFLTWIGDFLAPLSKMFGVSWSVLVWIFAAIAIVGLLYLLFRLLSPALDWRPGRKTAAAEPEWTPDREEAIALLDDADRLAEQGDFDGATHLLLQRSVNQMATARPDWVEPSSTARELAALSALPDSARSAFSTIAERVERSLFALRQLGQDDWQAAREAYSRFALERL